MNASRTVMILLLIGSCTSVLRRSGAAPSAPAPISVGVIMNAAGSSLTAEQKVTAMHVGLSCDASGSTESMHDIDDTHSVIQIFQSDVSCVIKLLSFTLGGAVYTPQGANGFKDYKPGEIALFSNGGQTLNVKVDTQLPSPTTDGSSARYLYSEVVADTILIADCPVCSTNISLGAEKEPAPGLYLLNFALSGSDASQKLQLTFSCRDELIVTDHGAERCDASALAQLLLFVGLKTQDIIDVPMLDANFRHALNLKAYLGPAPTGTSFTIVIPAQDMAIASSLAGGELLIAVRRNDGISYRYSIIKSGGQNQTANKKSCVYPGHGGEHLTLAHGATHEDQTQPRYALDACRVIGYAVYACIDGELFGPNVPVPSRSSCGSSGSGQNQNNHQNG